MTQAWMANNPGLVPPALAATTGPTQIAAGAAYAGLSVSTGVTITVISPGSGPGIGADVSGTHAQLAGSFLIDELGQTPAPGVAGNDLAAL
jgi:hypothetical protein